MKQANWIGVLLSLAAATVAVRAVDRTKTIQATGPNVVQSVVDAIEEKCIFPNDRLFIRRMAYVETEDGKDSSTFRPGFYGGIWQVTKSNYEATRLCKGNQLAEACSKIKKEFKIDWQKTKWEDLLKPFYSGLAAYLSLFLHQSTIPGRPADQEKVWMKVFHPKNFNATRSFSEVSTSSCNGNADVVFLLDESGSVGKSNFDKVKDFLTKTVSKLVIGPDNTRISFVKFGAMTTVVSYLNADNSSSQVKTTISNLMYRGGGTPTDKGINAVVNDVFTTKNGAKETKDAPRILVLVTDGQSDNNQRTVAAAHAAKAHKISIVSVGVGSGIDYDELRQMAEKCNLVFTLDSFDDFDNFIYQLTKKTCDAKAHISFKPSDGNGTSSNETISKTVTIKGNEEKGGVTLDPDNSTEGHTIVIESNCAVVKIYGSYDNENPSESMFQISGTASDGRPIVLFVKADKDGKPLFLSYKATKVNRTDKVCFNESSFVMRINKGKKEAVDILCDENGSLRNCTSVDIIQNKWQDKICTRASDVSVIGNPCTPDRLRAKKLFFPHPNDNSKFLKCDLKGRVYVIICPVGLFYEPGRDSCGTETNLPDTKERLNSGNNPCTHEAVMQHRMYFPYPANHHYYIQCDQWGGAWIVPCSSNEVWSQRLTQCIPENVEVKSPCTDEARAAGQFFFPYPPDKHKFIHCKNDNSFVIQSCGNMVYDPVVHNCLPG